MNEEKQKILQGLRIDPSQRAAAANARWSRRWMRERFDPAAFQARRDGIIARGSSQQ